MNETQRRAQVEALLYEGHGINDIARRLKLSQVVAARELAVLREEWQTRQKRARRAPKDEHAREQPAEETRPDGEAPR